MTSLNAAYFGREQTAVKHEMLRRYLGPAARIIGSFANCFVYVDCCSGPWNSATDDFKDSSFSIACEQLRAARKFLQDRNRTVEFRCLFIEENPSAFGQLQQFCGAVKDIEVNPLLGDFTTKIADIRRFIHERPKPFAFFFIDPTGWSPLAISAIGPLLKEQSSEVLINFMTSHIRRFLEHSNFEATLGPDYMQKIVGLTGQDRGDGAAYSFAEEIRRFYPHTCTSVVPNPLRDEAYFHLVYGTRHLKGLEKFKEAEKSCFGFMQEVRLGARHRQQTQIGGGQELQQLLFDISPVQDHYLQQLRTYYLDQAFESLKRRMGAVQSEEQAWSIVSRFPLVWKSDLHLWWRSHGPRPGQPETRTLRA